MNEDLNLKGLKVLAIDNDLSSLYLIKLYLLNMNCEGDFVDTIEEAVAKLKTNKYDICFSDINLPVASGLQLAKFIREHISKDMPIIATTASMLAEDKHLCFESGMNGFLSKPLDINLLKAEIKLHLDV